MLASLGDRINEISRARIVCDVKVERRSIETTMIEKNAVRWKYKKDIDECSYDSYEVTQQTK